MTSDLELPNPPLPPLTAEGFAAGCVYRYRGVPICEDENGHYVYAHGHVDPERFVGAVNDHDHEMEGTSYPVAPEDQYQPDQARHVWAVTAKAGDDPGDWYIAWPDEITESTPGAFPLTVVSR